MRYLCNLNVYITVEAATLIGLTFVAASSYIFRSIMARKKNNKAPKAPGSASSAPKALNAPKGETDTRPENSPYGSPSCTIPFASPLTVPLDILTRSPKLRAAYESRLPELPAIPEDVGHVLVHYLHTGTYGSLKPKPTATMSKQICELKTSIQAYAAARTYDLPDLMRLAEAKVDKYGAGLPLPALLEVARDAYPTLDDGDAWFLGYLRSRIRPHLEDPKLLLGSNLLDQISSILSPNRVLLRTVLELFCERIVVPPEPAPAVSPPPASTIASPITSPGSSRTVSPLPPASPMSLLEMRSRSVRREGFPPTRKNLKATPWPSPDNMSEASCARSMSPEPVLSGTVPPQFEAKPVPKPVLSETAPPQFETKPVPEPVPAFALAPFPEFGPVIIDVMPPPGPSIEAKTPGQTEVQPAPEREVKADIDPETKAEVEQDTKLPVQPEPEVKVAIEPETKVEQDTKLDIQPEVEPVPEPEVKAVIEPETKVEVEQDTKLPVQLEVEPVPEPEVEAVIESETKVEVEQDTKLPVQLEVEPVPEPEVKVAIEPETKVEVKQDTKLPTEPTVNAPSEVETLSAIEPDVKAPTEVETVVAVEPDVKLLAKTERALTVEPDVKAPAEVEVLAAVEPEVKLLAETERALTVEPDVKAPAEAETVVSVEPGTKQEDEIVVASPVPAPQRERKDSGKGIDLEPLPKELESIPKLVPELEAESNPHSQARYPVLRIADSGFWEGPDVESSKESTPSIVELKPVVSPTPEHIHELESVAISKDVSGIDSRDFAGVDGDFKSAADKQAEVEPEASKDRVSVFLPVQEDTPKTIAEAVTEAVAEALPKDALESKLEPEPLPVESAEAVPEMLVDSASLVAPEITPVQEQLPEAIQSKEFEVEAQPETEKIQEETIEPKAVAKPEPQPEAGSSHSVFPDDAQPAGPSKTETAQPSLEPEPKPAGETAVLQRVNTDSAVHSESTICAADTAESPAVLDAKPAPELEGAKTEADPADVQPCSAQARQRSWKKRFMSLRYPVLFGGRV